MGRAFAGPKPVSPIGFKIPRIDAKGSCKEASGGGSSWVCDISCAAWTRTSLSYSRASDLLRPTRYCDTEACMVSAGLTSGAAPPRQQKMTRRPGRRAYSWHHAPWRCADCLLRQLRERQAGRTQVSTERLQLPRTGRRHGTTTIHVAPNTYRTPPLNHTVVRLHKTHARPLTFQNGEDQ